MHAYTAVLAQAPRCLLVTQALCLRFPTLLLPAMELPIPSTVHGLHIDDLEFAASKIKGVVGVGPLVDATGQSRKSVGNHYSPHELEVFFEGGGRRARVVIGLTDFRGYLHIYMRTPRTAIAATARLFFPACHEVLMSYAALRTVARADFNGPEWGPEYLSFTKGQIVRPLQPPPGVAAEGWTYGWVKAGESGWYPPDYVRLLE